MASFSPGKQRDTVAIVYDGDGSRVSETVGGVTTNYLVDTVNPTGYAQVVDELQNGTVSRTYSYGLERISEKQTAGTSFYGYDGHGSVRQLSNSAGAVTDSYDYDAFGNLINSTGTTPNNYLFAGEQYDPALGLYYNRARYYNTTTGRFWSMDTDEGDAESPLSLHKYLYAGADPINHLDRSGNDFDLGSVTTALGVAGTLSAISNVLVAGAISAAYGSYPDAVAFGVFGAGEITGIGSGGSLAGIGGYEIVFAPRLKQERSFWWGGIEPSIGAPISPSDFGHLAHGRHREAGIFIAWYWNLDDLEPGNFGLYAITAGTGRVAQAFDFVDTIETVGAPLFAFFAKGGYGAACSAAFDSAEISWYKQHRTRPCRERKDGAPTVSEWERKTNSERVGHPSLVGPLRGTKSNESGRAYRRPLDTGGTFPFEPGQGRRRVLGACAKRASGGSKGELW